METKKLTCCDLMVGDWVNIYTFPNNNFKESDLFPAKITTIMTPLPSETQDGGQVEGIFQATDTEDGFAVFARPIDTLLPIPLTAEILEKNGFSELMLHDEWSRIFRAYHDDLFIEVGIYEPMFINIGYVDKEGEEHPLSDIVKIHGENFYVHDLQHALRLCGVDKEIML